jgi:predicted transcriptional regulator
MEPIMTPRQCAAARALLSISQPCLAERAGVSRRVVQKFESEEGPVKPVTITAIRAALEASGVTLLFSPLEGVAIRPADP